MDCCQWPCWTDIFACAATYTPVLVYGRNPQPVIASRILSHHSDGIGRTMLRAVAAMYAICVYDTIVKVDYCYTYLDR